jgi:hypothetical protein
VGYVSPCRLGPAYLHKSTQGFDYLILRPMIG